MGVTCAHGHNNGRFFVLVFVFIRGRSSVSAGCQTWITHSGVCLTLVITSDCEAGMSSFVGLQ